MQKRETRNRPGLIGTVTQFLEGADPVGMYFDFLQYPDGWYWAFTGEMRLHGPFPTLEEAVQDAKEE